MTPEFSIRIMDESYAAENKTISKVGFRIHSQPVICLRKQVQISWYWHALKPSRR